MPGAIFASSAILARYNCIQRKERDSTGKECDYFEYKGWRFSSHHTKIIDSSALDAMQRDLCNDFSDYNMHLPPQIFGNDIMRCEQVSLAPDLHGFQLSLNSRDSLYAWSTQHSQTRTALQPLHIIQVPYARTWIERSRAALTSSSSSNQNESKDGPESGGRGNNQIFDYLDNEIGTINIDDSVAHRAWDWTFSSDYCGTLRNVLGDTNEVLTFNTIKELLTRDEGAGQGRLGGKHTVFEDFLFAGHRVVQSQSSGVDYTLLRARDVPILFFDEIQLYSDDLEDCGEVCFDAKLRVMPQCWFLLLRMFLRVDGVLVRIRECRYYHAFGAADVHLEVQWKECALTADPSQLPYSMPHSELPPADLRDANKLSQLVPITHQRFCTIRL